MKNQFNPFLTVGYRGKKYFCDREEESKLLTNFFLSGTNVTLFAIRRLGKTGLINHVFYPYRNNIKVACIYIDVLSTNNLNEFTNEIATAIHNLFPKKNNVGNRFLDFIKSFRPLISFDEFSGTPSISLTLDTQSQKEKTIRSIFNFLDNQDIKVVFAIDEFQQILNYPEKNIEAILRTQMQQLKNISFIFSGSNQNMMQEIFNNAKRPFFASCTNLTLNPIDKKKYKSFINKKFKENNREITIEAIDFILDWTKVHTFYVQYFCRILFSNNYSKNGMKEINETALFILKLNENNYYQIKNMLTKAQWKLLTAIGKEEEVYHPQAKQFINNHQLGTPSLVKRGIEALLKKELIYYVSNIEKPYYQVYDKFLMRWIQML